MVHRKLNMIFATTCIFNFEWHTIKWLQIFKSLLWYMKTWMTLSKLFWQHSLTYLQIVFRMWHAVLMSILNFNMSFALGDTHELECQNFVISSFTSSDSFLSKHGSLPPKAHVSFWRGSSIISYLLSVLLKVVWFRFKSIQVCLIYLPFLKWWLAKEVVITLRETLLSFSLLFFPMLLRVLKGFFTIMVFLSIFLLRKYSIWKA